MRLCCFLVELGGKVESLMCQGCKRKENFVECEKKDL